MHIHDVMQYLNASVSPFHAVREAASRLLAKGFVELPDEKSFTLVPGQGYFLTRNQTSLIAFRVPEAPRAQFQVAAAHSDSPTFKLKPAPLLEGKTLRYNVEPYGGMIYSTWFDRPLSIAGRVLVRTESGVESRLLSIDEDIAVIPSVAIHLNREANRGVAYNPAIDLLPLVGLPSGKKSFDAYLYDHLDDPNVLKVLSHDLFLYVREKAKTVGLRQEFLLSPRLDDLSSAYCALEGFLTAKNIDAIAVYALFDNEEVGSLTRQGANGTFLRDTLTRIQSALFGSGDDMASSAISGTLLSVDNAHANHPNHPELSDQTTDVRLNGGIVLKYNAAQKYTTDAYSAALVKTIASIAGVSVQEYTNRSDLPGGSTLGNLSNSEVSFVAADIGLPQLAMHSAVELCGQKDVNSMIRFMAAYYSADIRRNDAGFQVDITD